MNLTFFFAVTLAFVMECDSTLAQTTNSDGKNHASPQPSSNVVQLDEHGLAQQKRQEKNTTEMPISRAHLAVWLEHAEQSRTEVFRLARIGRNRRGGEPWFSPTKSLIVSKGELVAVRYFSAYHVGAAIAGAPYYVEYQRRIREGDPMFVGEYDLRTKTWSLVPLERIADNTAASNASQSNKQNIAPAVNLPKQDPELKDAG